MRDMIFPGERCAFFSLAFQRRILSNGLSEIVIERCFSSCQSGLVVAIVTFSRMKRGFGFPIPNGLKWSISSSVFTSIFSGGSGHSIDRVFFGRLVISCIWAN